MTEQKCPKCGSEKDWQQSNLIKYKCGTFQDSEVAQGFDCVEREQAYNRGFEAGRATLPSDEDVRKESIEIWPDIEDKGYRETFESGAFFVLDLIRAQSPRDGWISVQEPPEHSNIVAVASDSECGEGRYEFGEWFTDLVGINTHWQPLPEPPKAEP